MPLIEGFHKVELSTLKKQTRENWSVLSCPTLGPPSPFALNPPLLDQKVPSSQPSSRLFAAHALTHGANHHAEDRQERRSLEPRQRSDTPRTLRGRNGQSECEVVRSQIVQTKEKCCREPSSKEIMILGNSRSSPTPIQPLRSFHPDPLNSKDTTQE